MKDRNGGNRFVSRAAQTAYPNENKPWSNSEKRTLSRNRNEGAKGSGAVNPASVTRPVTPGTLNFGRAKKTGPMLGRGGDSGHDLTPSPLRGHTPRLTCGSALAPSVAPRLRVSCGPGGFPSAMRAWFVRWPCPNACSREKDKPPRK